MWQIKPIVCQMFLCDRAQEAIFKHQRALADEWEGLKERK
jgi:hypothetical protein